MASVFKSDLDKSYFQWQHIPYLERIHWNYLLRRVVEIDTRSTPNANDNLMDKRAGATLKDPVDPGCPNFYNQEMCLALTPCQAQRATPPPVPIGDTEPGKKSPSKRDALPSLATGFDNEFVVPRELCWDYNPATSPDMIYPYGVKPRFNYYRPPFNLMHFNGSSTTDVYDGYQLQSLTIGSLVWLYFYERMGIFKILGVLLDDYNYRGKYSLSSQIREGELKNKQYIELLEHLSLLSRQGLASTLRDRVSTYQRVLGVTVQNDLNVQSTENSPFMRNFSKLIGNMLEYYNAKRLAVAIQTNAAPVRTSVATQTAILNTIKVLCQNFEVMEYGRNMIHTFTGIATVYVTLCLIKQIRDVIGIPREYDTPEEYVPAAYDILVLKKQGAPADANRYTVFDNCASYGYRILTDVQLANVSNFRLGDMSSPFDAWLSSVEEWVEGYNNAFKSIPDKTTSESAVVTA